jgi:hypothetical protein
MGAWRKAAGALVAAVVAVGGCGVAAHVGALQPSAVPASPPLHIPGQALPGSFQRGIDIDFYTYPGQNVARAAAATVQYVKSLHANAIAISFPFFMTSRYAPGMEAGRATPTPGRLATVITDAQQAGMRVTLRPLLDERALGKARAHWIPADKAAWFASYQRFLTPYLVMAQRLHVSEFITGAELTYFSQSRHWDKLNTAIRRIYHGEIGCADNWSVQPNGCGTAAVQLVDAYQPLHPPLNAAWRSYDARFPRGTVLAEISIAAVHDAWAKPYLNYWPGATLDPAMQVQWFTDACHAAIATHLGGMYLWSLGLSASQGRQNAVHQSRWANSPGAAAIARCYAQIAASSR